MVNVKINKKQAQKFARIIFADIEAYLQEHKEEYEAFLNEEGPPKTGGEDDESSSKTA